MAAAAAAGLHHLLVLTFGILGNIVSICVYFAPLPTFICICEKKSTMGFESLPYVVALFSANVWMYYAILLKTKAAILLISINSFGCLIQTLYIIIFLLYATSKQARKQTIKLVAFLNLGVFASILLSTFFLLPDPASRVRVVGWIAVAISIAVFAAPLNIVFKVVRSGSVEFMPFTLSLSLTISAVMWFAYGLLLSDCYVALPNVIGFFLGLVQMVLYGIYKKKGIRKLVMKKAAAVNMGMGANPDHDHQVHPIHVISDGDKTCEQDAIDHDIDVVVLDPQQVKENDIYEDHENEKARVDVNENINVDLIHAQQQQQQKGDHHLSSEMNIINLQIAVAA